MNPRPPPYPPPGVRILSRTTMCDAAFSKSKACCRPKLQRVPMRSRSRPGRLPNVLQAWPKPPPPWRHSPVGDAWVPQAKPQAKPMPRPSRARPPSPSSTSSSSYADDDGASDASEATSDPERDALHDGVHIVDVVPSDLVAARCPPSHMDEFVRHRSVARRLDVAVAEKLREVNAYEQAATLAVNTGVAISDRSAVGCQQAIAVAAAVLDLFSAHDKEYDELILSSQRAWADAAVALARARDSLFQ